MTAEAKKRPMPAHNLTDAQRRALLWLPADGDFVSSPPKDLAHALASLCRWHPILAGVLTSSFSLRSLKKYYLAEAGVALRKEIEHG